MIGTCSLAANLRVLPQTVGIILIEQIRCAGRQNDHDQDDGRRHGSAYPALNLSGERVMHRGLWAVLILLLPSPENLLHPFKILTGNNRLVGIPDVVALQLSMPSEKCTLCKARQY